MSGAIHSRQFSASTAASRHSFSGALELRHALAEGSSSVAQACRKTRDSARMPHSAACRTTDPQCSGVSHCCRLTDRVHPQVIGCVHQGFSLRSGRSTVVAPFTFCTRARAVRPESECSTDPRIAGPESTSEVKASVARRSYGSISRRIPTARA